jgi:hypothetical protein
MMKTCMIILLPMLACMAQAQRKDAGGKVRCSTTICRRHGLGAVGAAVYYVSHATAFWPAALGLLTALVWPAFLVYEALKSLHA